jgi:pimeloyl-ACP methyl ester carboxylesterase
MRKTCEKAFPRSRGDISQSLLTKIRLVEISTRHCGNRLIRKRLRDRGIAPTNDPGTESVLVSACPGLHLSKVSHQSPGNLIKSNTNMKSRISISVTKHLLGIRGLLGLVVLALAAAALTASPLLAGNSSGAADESPQTVHYHTVKLDGLDIFYREAGPKNAPTILLLHGFPTSSNMFRNLIPKLATSFHVVAPDYPGFGQSSMPSHTEYAYTFANLSNVVGDLVDMLGLKHYSMYVMDYGAPVGYRLALRYPERVQALIVQNGNAYDEGLLKFWDPIKKYWADPTPENRQGIHFIVDSKSTRWQYENGVSDKTLLDPTTWTLDQIGLDRPGNDEIQLDLFLDYGTNVPLYPKFQEFFRKYQPPTLIVWGKNDVIFPPEGATPYSRDLKVVETHMLDTGHFALETHGAEIAHLIKEFMAKHGISE